MTSLAPSERGFVWPIHDLIYGNEEKDRKPVKNFLTEVKKYPGLLQIIEKIEGLINHRGIHASGVNFYDDDPFKTACFMKATSGAIVTQFSLHDAEYCGDVKFDFLVTEIQDVIVQCLNMLQEYNEVEQGLSLRQLYDKYLHPDVLPIEDEKMWKALAEGKVLKLFQFDSQVGSQTVKLLQPKTPREMANCNSVMRLMAAEKGGETPTERYKRMKDNISRWYREMSRWNLREEDQKILERYYLETYATPAQQEDMMMILMDENICNFSLKEANDARKICAKKQMNRIEELHELVLKKATSEQLGEYVWETAIKPQMGYSFSLIHSLAYSFVGLQTIYLATYFDPVYWNTACLIVNSGSLEEQEIDNKEDKQIEEYLARFEDDLNQEDYQDLIEIQNKNKKIEKTTDYSKLAKAIGDITSKGIKVSLIDINKSGFSFEPDEENNEILFGLKGVNKIGGPVINQIISGRPYTGIIDFMNRCPLNKTQMISLIKSGAFDKIDNEWASKICKDNPRYAIMAYYISLICEPKKRLTLQNFNGLLKNKLIPDTLNKQKQIFVFNKFLKENKKVGKYYVFDEGSLDFYSQYYDLNILDVINGITCILQTKWDKIYQKEMDDARNWLKDNQEEILNQYNNLLFNEAWNKYAIGNISAWEMESLCFYYHEHELNDLDKHKYGIVNFSTLSYEPEVDYFFKRAGREIPIFKLYKIAGTIISKDNTKASVVILTTDGIVNVKFTKEYYAMYNRQISEVQSDGSKKVLEKGWFSRGTKIMVTGYRREDTFVAKTYKSTATHQLYRITDVDGKNITLEHERININE